MRRLIHPAMMILLCTAVLLVACGPQELVDPTITPEVVAAENTAVPTMPATNTPAVTETPVPAPDSPTAEPTAPPTATPAATATATAVPAAPIAAVDVERVVGGFVKPLGVEHAGDERLFVVQQAGVISVIDAAGQVLSEPFLNIDGRVNSTANEQGLLGLAFHPNYADNGRFFLNYSNDNGDTTIAEYRVSADNADRADVDSERILMTIGQPYRNHNGGQLRFGPDGYLYIGMGDGGSQGDPMNMAQDAGTLLGAMLRIDVDNGDPYAVPADNPYVNDDDKRNEIWAIGLRNPWRFSFDRETGDFYMADVGQNEWEEINYQPAGEAGGANYGWNWYEAGHCYTDGCDPAGLTMPAAEYNHDGRHCSVTGGFVYRGQAYPALTGNYFYADYCSGQIWRLFPTADGGWDEDVVGQADFLVSSFGQDVNGEVYVVNQGEGALYRLVPGG